eukprot:751644-Hanusia_phi.AAC.1
MFNAQQWAAVSLFLLLTSAVQGDQICGTDRYFDTISCNLCCSTDRTCSTAGYSACCDSTDCTLSSYGNECTTTSCRERVLNNCCKDCSSGSHSTSTSKVHDLCMACLDGERVSDNGCVAEGSTETYESSSDAIQPPKQESWFMKSGLTSVAFIVTICLHCSIVLVTIALQLFTVDQRETRLLGRYTLPLLWFFYDICYMSARFNWFLTSSEARDMKAYKVTGQSSDELVWVPGKDSDYETCVPPGSIGSMQNTLCGFGVFDFTTIILGQESKYENNSAKFSVGLGIIIWSFISFYIMMKNASMSDSLDQEVGEGEETSAVSKSDRNEHAKVTPGPMEALHAATLETEDEDTNAHDTGGEPGHDKKTGSLNSKTANDIADCKKDDQRAPIDEDEDDDIARNDMVKRDGQEKKNCEMKDEKKGDDKEFAMNKNTQPSDISPHGKQEDAPAKIGRRGSDKNTDEVACDVSVPVEMLPEDVHSNESVFKRIFQFDRERLKRRVIWFLLSTALASQQSLVLLPVTSIEITPFCFQLQVDLPVSSSKAACWHKWSIAGIPYGVPSIFIGGILVFMAGEADKRSKNNSVVGLVGLIGLVLLLTGIGLFLFWLFGGIFIGIWFTFASAKILADLAFTKIFAPVLIVMSTDFVLLHARVPSRFCCFRVPPQVMQTKLRLHQMKARFDVRVYSAFRAMGLKMFPSLRRCFEQAGQDLQAADEEDVRATLDFADPPGKQQPSRGRKSLEDKESTSGDEDIDAKSTGEAR